jgi:PhzF family phenazine biosynthesis protein
MMKLLQIDAFTDRPFQGNPAAVCILDAPASPGWMQQVAAEMNLSETAFVFLENAQTDRYRLQWFTPTTEVDLCGHATLATAYALWSESLVSETKTIVFDTRSGELQATLEDRWIRLNFPASLSAPVMQIPAGLTEALGLSLEPRRICSNSLGYLVGVSTEAIVRELEPDFTHLKTFAVPGVIVTSPSDRSFDFISRFFAPNLGINEDPVTGSAHCCLAPYWYDRQQETQAKQETTGEMKSKFLAYQASPRGGVVQMEYLKDSQRVILAGQAVTILRGELTEY